MTDYLAEISEVRGFMLNRTKREDDAVMEVYHVIRVSTIKWVVVYGTKNENRCCLIRRDEQGVLHIPWDFTC